MIFLPKQQHNSNGLAKDCEYTYCLFSKYSLIELLSCVMHVDYFIEVTTIGNANYFEIEMQVDSSI